MALLGSLTSIGADEAAFLKVLETIVADRVEPVAQRIDEEGEIPAELFGLLADAGILALGLEAEAGGGGADLTVSLAAVQILARSSAALGFLVAMHHAAASAAAGIVGAGVQLELDNGDPVMPMLVDGCSSSPLGLDTGHAGTRVSGAASSMNRVLMSAPIIVSLGSATEEKVGLVEPLATGVRFGTPTDRTGLRGAPTSRVTFEATPMELGSSCGTTATLRELCDLGIAAVALGIAERANEESAEHVQRRWQFGRPLVEFGGVQAILEEMTKRTLQAATTVVCATGRDGGSKSSSSERRPTGIGYDVARATVATCIDAVQLHGGAGYVRDGVVERLFRDALSLRARSSRFAASHPANLARPSPSEDRLSEPVAGGRRERAAPAGRSGR